MLFDDENYKSALEYADVVQKGIYEAEAKAINEIQKGILAISQKEDPFDQSGNYQKIMRYGDEKLKGYLRDTLCL